MLVKKIMKKGIPFIVALSIVGTSVPVINNTYIISASTTMSERILNDTSLGLSADKKRSLASIAEALLNEGYEQAFIAGVLGNIVCEGSFGKFESSHYITNPGAEPDYLLYMDKYWNYRNEYSGQNITNKSLSKVYKMICDLDSKGYKDQGSRCGFGLGCAQWTFGRTKGLIEKYIQVAGGSDTITAEQVMKAEGLYMVDEINTTYKSVYTNWKNSNYANLSSSTAAENAGKIVCTQYEKPSNFNDKQYARGAMAAKIFKAVSYITPTPVVGCFDACDSGYTSIVEALKSIGVDSSMTYRKQIAVANSISGYSGTAAQNTEMLNKLKAGTLKVPGPDVEVNVPEPPPVVNYDNIYFPACSSSYTSIVDALKSIGVDSSMSNRTRIAEKNGISEYSGTASQNTDLLSKLKTGKLINPDGVSATPNVSGKYYPACGSSYTSIVEALKSIGVDSSMTYRKEIAAKNGISGYSGTAEQNIQMLSLLKSGSLVRADYSEPPAIVNYTVTLDSCGGFSSVSSLSVASNASYVGLPVATKEGYTFAGWYTSANGGSLIKDGNSLVSASNHTLYAHWIANTYTVSFESNDGSGISSTQKVVFGNQYGNLPSVSRTGYSLAGWGKNSIGENIVKSTDIYNIADNQMLYAVWNANKYTVSFDSNGGNEKISSKSVEYDDFYGTLEEITREGYSFEGWYTSKENGEQITDESRVSITENQTLFAHWKKNAEVHEELVLESASVNMKNGEQYTIKANQKDLTYKSSNTEVAVVSKSGIITAVGEGNVVITVYNSEFETVQINVIVTSAVLKGDSNSDGKLTAADALIIQKWLFNIGEISNMKTADLNDDGIINIVDLILIKNKIISQ